MDEKLFSARMAEYKSAVDKYLDACLEETQCASYHKLTDSMHYSLTAGGKRLRAILVLEFCRICGGDVEKALPVACGVEMLHTYSLIHDDLPVMDNDDLRRGKPSNHKVFGECTATLAGDALQALAFETVLKADLPALRVLKCAQVLANAAGHEGICGGQQLDLEWEGKILSAPELEEIYLRKTSALIRAACLMGVAAAGGTKETVIEESGAAQYLGEKVDEATQETVSVYGRKLLLTLLIEVYAPRTLGAVGCEKAAEAVTQALMTALPEGLKLGSLQWGKTGWDKTTGMFRLDASAKYAAYFVAEAAEDETVFTDFILKGTVKERE